MNDDQRIRERFESLDFGPEPPMAASMQDDVRRGVRRMRRRQVAVLASAGLAVMGVAGATFGVAGLLNSHANGLQAAGGSGAVATATPTPTPPPTGPTRGSTRVPMPPTGPTPTRTPTPPPTAPVTPTRAPVTGPDGFEYPATRAHLVTLAAAHFDPAYRHLERQSSNVDFTGDGRTLSVGTKLGWRVSGESGEAMVQPVVTTAGYATSDSYAVADFAANLDCEIGTSACVRARIPGASGPAWTSSRDGGRSFTVIYQRPDGSLTGVVVDRLFGNNSTTPVSSVSISRDQAYAFVTDPKVRVDPSEAHAAASQAIPLPPQPKTK